MVTRSRAVLFGCVLPLVACSAGGTSRDLVVGTQGSGGAGAGPDGPGGTPLALPDASTTSVLSAHIESPPGVTVEFVTVSCSNACADVVAVAKGGFAPYAFVWDDGSTDPHRHVCPAATTSYEVTVTDAGMESVEFEQEPQTVKAPLTANVIACPTDAGVVSPPDGGDAGRPPLCVTGDIAVGDPLGGTVTYFRQGAAVPAGRYRVSYLDGCMKYGPPVGWTIHNQLPISWFLVGETAANVLGTLPGITGLGLDSFDACVAESLKQPPLEVDFAGGKVGVVMVDYPLTDNIAGLDGRNPTWCLTPL